MYFCTCFRGLDKKTCQWCTTKMLCSWSHTHCIAQNMLQGPCSRHHQNCKLLSTVRLSPSVLQVRPLLKKPSLDQNMLKNYRPVSSLLFLSKFLERVMLLQLTDHVSRNNLLAGISLPTARIVVVKLHFFTSLTACWRALIRDVSPFSPCWICLLPLTQLTIAFFQKDCIRLLEAQVQPFNGYVHTSWTDFKSLL